MIFKNVSLFIFVVLILFEPATLKSEKKGKGRRKGKKVTQTVTETGVREPFSGQRIRLGINKNLDGYSNGLLEVYRGGQWGMVCDDDWDEQDADVACRELGFSLGAKRPVYRRPPDQDRWDSSSFVINNVECQGNEKSLLSCPYSTNNECQVSEAVSVTCVMEDNKECGDSKSGSWIAGEESCYMITPFSKGHNFRKILKECAGHQENSYLAIIETESEHNFVSNLLSRHGMDIDRVILSSKLSKKKGSVWKWQKYTRKQKEGKKWRGALQRKLVKMSYHKWFPGWEPSKFGAEPSVSKGKFQCLSLSQKYKQPSGKDKSVHFFYFDSAPCKPNRKENVYFVCETDRKPSYGQAVKVHLEECYRGNGESYRGTKAVTRGGTPCIKWTMSTRANPWTHPDAGLGDHKYCRNPDGDKQPWCWVKVGTNNFGYCDIPECNKAPVTTTTAAPKDCPREEFYCYNHRKNPLYTKECIHGSFRCDGENDCDEAEDELNCEYKLPLYKKVTFSVLRGEYQEKYIRIALEYCARLCLESTSYVCRSFAYRESLRQCLLFDENSATSSLGLSIYYDYYELKSQSDINCLSGYQCNNGRCVGIDDLCNNIDDCLDLSDETGCDDTVDDTIEVRLADGKDEHSGRVEVNYLGEWGVICDDNWDIKDAMVVCRMLGYEHALSVVGRSHFGSGNKNFLLDEVDCHGNETSLLECKSSPWKDHDCASYEVAGVYCQQTKACNQDEFACNNSKCIQQTSVCNSDDDCLDESDERDCELKIELLNGTKSEGRVEIIRNGVRGTVCDDDWDDAAATVICRHLGYNTGVAKSDSYFGAGTGLIWLDNVVCLGNELHLDSCHFDDWGKHDCDHSEDAGVICSNRATTHSPSTTAKPDLQVSITLAGNSSFDGRIVLTVNGVEGSICDDQFGDEDATVVCRMLGFNSGTAVSNAASVYGEGTGKILMDDLTCTGSETLLTDCYYTSDHDCTHSEDAGVICHHKENTGMKVSLIGGVAPYEGRIEVTVNGTTGGICIDDLTSGSNAGIVCQVLGYRGLDTVYNVKTSYTNWLQKVHCLKRQTISDECTSGNIWRQTPCDSPAGVICITEEPTSTTTGSVSTTTYTESSTEPTTLPLGSTTLPLPDSVEVQLTGGKTENEGNVLLIHGEQKGVICDDSWDNKDATVICRMLGYSYGNATAESHFGFDLDPVWLDDVECTGIEESILECPNNGWMVNNCGVIREIAGVVCHNLEPTKTEVTVSLHDGSFEGEGRVEVSRGKENGTVCDDYWDFKDARVVCKMLGYRNGMAVRKGAYGPGMGPILLDNVQCQGTETNIISCVNEGWGNSNCDHSEDAGVVCGDEEMSFIPKVELVGGESSSEGRVEIIFGSVRGTLCSHNFDVTKATVVCRMLGYSAASVLPEGKYGPGTGMIWASENWNCQGSESDVKSCENFPGVKSQCTHTEDVSLRCHDEPTTTTTTKQTTKLTTEVPVMSGIQIELVNGNSPTRGRVEIIRNGVRGTVCDDRWDDNDATVICRMLGYNKGGTAVSEGVYGAGSGDILLDDVECDGSEDSIEDCGHLGWGVSNCHHMEDAGVRCREESLEPSTDDWQSLFSPNCGKRPKEDKKLRKKRQTLKLGGATVEERPQPAKIVYGQMAEYGMYPWQVGVRKVYYYDYYSQKKISQVWCGGTIINKYWILSAAHCFDGMAKSKISIRTGDHNNKKEDQYEQEFDVESILMHEDYDPNTYDYDIALIKISSDNGQGIVFNDYVQPACLPDLDTPYRPGTLCHISGWGKTENDVHPNILRKEKVPLMSDSKCSSLYKRGAISSHMLCAGYEEGGIDTCQGDSGGPLVCLIDGKYTVLGATSWGNGCGDAGYPGVYAHVRNLLTWITDKLKKYN